MSEDDSNKSKMNQAALSTLVETAEAKRRDCLQLLEKLLSKKNIKDISEVINK